MGHKVLHGGIFMIDSYDVMLNGEPVGTVRLIKQGLYYAVQCRCCVASREIYRLYAHCGADRIRLGVPVPQGNGLVLETKIPAKKLNTQSVEFYIESDTVRQQTEARSDDPRKFITVYPDEPFAYLAKLKNSYMETRNGKPGIMIKD